MPTTWCNESSGAFGALWYRKVRISSQNGSADMSVDSDPSLSSINATAFHASQLSSPPSSSSADCTGGFQMSHISIEPDIETDPFSRRCQPFNCSDVDDSHKTSIDNGKFSVGIQHFKIPLRIYPGTTRFVLFLFL
ncbi:hypothetical protein Y032_0004g2238 [Ancylostoma ceylanicum]|uniref:Uncharacterized protein n=2 Tax=Ancylostoma ceylanicum TaxID=53326 RepID=A0A016VVJ5_9BILA|nr:hypothetical protein Y032_0004g2238 [Ancylostoma ceylanicum]